MAGHFSCRRKVSGLSNDAAGCRATKIVDVQIANAGRIFYVIEPRIETPIGHRIQITRHVDLAVTRVGPGLRVLSSPFEAKHENMLPVASHLLTKYGFEFVRHWKGMNVVTL